MQTALHFRTRVLPGHRLEIVAPELNIGEEVTVFIVMAETTPTEPKKTSVMELLDSLPPGPRSASTWEEVERNLQEDRDSWDR